MKKIRIGDNHWDIFIKNKARWRKGGLGRVFYRISHLLGGQTKTISLREFSIFLSARYVRLQIRLAGLATLYRMSTLKNNFRALIKKPCPCLEGKYIFAGRNCVSSYYRIDERKLNSFSSKFTSLHISPIVGKRFNGSLYRTIDRWRVFIKESHGTCHFQDESFFSLSRLYCDIHPRCDISTRASIILLVEKEFRIY